MLTAEGANRSQAWLHCKFHPQLGSTAKPPSKWEGLAHAAVQKVAAHGVVATESKVLGREVGPTDLLFPVQHSSSSSMCWVAVEVDGEGHFEKPWGGGSQLRQRRVDEEKDAAAWRSRLPVVRLHHADVADWHLTLLMARSLAQQQCLFTLFTPSYEDYNLATQLCPAGGNAPIKQTWGQVRTR